MKKTNHLLLHRKKSIVNVGVQYILDNIYEALMSDPAKRFSECEMAFFTRWWYEQVSDVQQFLFRSNTM